MAKSRFSQYMPNRGLQLGNAIAQGASAFSGAYRQAHQQQIMNQRANEQIAMRKQYYDLQMQKIQKDMEPVTVNAQNIGTLKTLVQNGIVDQSTLNKYVSDTMGQVNTPAKASYAKQLADGLANGIPMNKAESGIYEKQVGLESSENIRGSMIQSQQGIENSRASRDYQKMAQEFQIQSQKLQAEREADKKNFDLKLKEMQMKFDEMTQTRQLKEKELGQTKDLKNAEIEANVATKREGYESAERRAKITASARSKSNSGQPPRLKALYDTLLDVNKSINNFDSGKQDMFETKDSKAARRAKLQQTKLDVLAEINQLEGVGGSKPSTSTSSSSSVSAPQGYFKDGRVGPIAPSAAVPAASGSVRVKDITTGQTGNWDLSKGKPDPTRFQVLDQ